MYGWGLGAAAGTCPAGMTYETAWSLTGQTSYPAQASGPGMCMAPMPTCPQVPPNCQNVQLSVPAADGSVTATCAPVDPNVITQLKANPSFLQNPQFTAGANPAYIACLSQAIGVTPPSSSSGCFALFGASDTCPSGIPVGVLTIGVGAGVLLLLFLMGGKH